MNFCLLLPLQSIFGPEAMAELLTFKGELEMEIKNLQQAMISQEGENSISQISRLLGQVTKLEYQLEMKESECESLKAEVEGLKKINANVKKLDEGSNACLENAIIAQNDVKEQGKIKSRIDCSTQVSYFTIQITSFQEGLHGLRLVFTVFLPINTFIHIRPS